MEHQGQGIVDGTDQSLTGARTETEWEALMIAANRGDAAAYGTLLRAMTPVLRGIIRARGHRLGAETCEDVLQNVLLAIHLKRHTWREGDPLRPWVYALTRYKVVDAFRAQGHSVTLPIEEFADVLPAAALPDPVERADMLRVIGALDGRSADILRAIGMEGASIAETGRRLSMTEGAVRVALHRGLKRLAKLRERMLE